MAKAKKFLAFLAIPLICIWYCTAQEYSIEQARKIRKNVVACAKQYIGCPYRSGAIGPDAFDCSGLIYTVMREGAKLQMPRSAKAIYSKAKTIKLSQAEEGDLVFFKTTGDGSISHVGIFIGKNQFIHAASSGANTGVIVSSLKERYYANSFAGAGRVLPSGNNSNSDSEKNSLDEASSKNAAASMDEKSNERNSASKNS
ncbi:MAG: C40 family peptidase [Treponemataceae bacterium]|nr:C40 family peptidase [Treponemataceae bacterium]